MAGKDAMLAGEMARQVFYEPVGIRSPQELRAQLTSNRRKLLRITLRLWLIRLERWWLAALIFVLKLPDHWPWLSRTIDPLFKKHD